MAPELPNALTLMNLAKHNGYRTRFMYAGEAGFDKMDQFVKNREWIRLSIRTTLAADTSCCPSTAAVSPEVIPITRCSANTWMQHP